MRGGAIKSMRGKPLSTNQSLIVSAVMGLLIFALLAILFEGLFRGTRLSSTLQLRSHGVYHAQFEIKWFALEDFVQENGGVDVILLGNSMVNTGIDPEILGQRYEYRTGRELRIFNFGVEGLTVAPNSALARLLVREYHPGVLIFVTEMRDYTAVNGVDIEEQLLSDEWLTARLGGKVTLRAWLKDRSFLVKHLLPYRNWNRADFPDTFLQNQYRKLATSPSGYEADYYPRGTAWLPPDPADPAEQALFSMFANYTMDPGRLANLADLLAVTSEGTRVLITELPLHPNYFLYFNDPAAHAKYLEELVPFITSRGGVFLPPLPSELIPDSFRSDYYHLNYKGAMVYSALLADQLAELCLNEGVCLQPMEQAR
jgi:hypothetical protein